MPKTTDKSPRFDAVAESRKWKEAVARETKGMTVAERMAWFRQHSLISAVRTKKKVGVALAH